MDLQQQGFDVTLLSQPALATPAGDAIGLENVVDKLDSDRWAERQSDMDASTGFTPSPSTKALDPFSWLPARLNLSGFNDGDKILQTNPGKPLVALHWQGNPAMNILSIPAEDRFHLSDCCPWPTR